MANDLFVALIGYPTGKILERHRRWFDRRRVWPETWMVWFKDEEPSIPSGHYEAFKQYVKLPPWVRLKAEERSASLTVDERKFLLSKGLLEEWSIEDAPEFLGSRPIREIREISKRLGAGKARSRRELVHKIMMKATAAEVYAATVSVVGGLIRRIKTPFDELPEDWVLYQKYKAPMLLEFFTSKYFSHRVLKHGRRPEYTTSVDCIDACMPFVERFAWRESLGFHDYPPWYPGCCCGLLPRIDI